MYFCRLQADPTGVEVKMKQPIAYSDIPYNIMQLMCHCGGKLYVHVPRFPGRVSENTVLLYFVGAGDPYNRDTCLSVCLSGNLLRSSTFQD